MRGFLGRWGGFLVLTAVVLLLPLILPNRFYFDMAVKVWLNAIVCVGLNLLIGYAGQISLGHAGFFALGAYASAILTRRFEIPGLVAMLMGAAGVGLLAFLVARPILKLKGHYLAMATLGLGIIVAIVINREIWLTGGPDGVRVPALFIGDWRVSRIIAWLAIISETTSPAPKRLTSRRNGRSEMPDKGAKTTGASNAIGPIWMLIIRAFRRGWLEFERSYSRETPLTRRCYRLSLLRRNKVKISMI